MEMFFLAAAADCGEEVRFPAHESRHIVRACRHRSGDRLFATDGAGCELELELADANPQAVRARVLGRRVRPREPRVLLTLALGVIKPDRFSGVVEAATQLGASSVVPVLTARVVARLRPERLERMRRVAVEAMKSSTRTVVPDVTAPAGFDELLGMVGRHEQALVAYEGESGPGMADIVEPGAGSVLVIVGPEGGFEFGEVERLRAAGARSFSMGPRRLRSEVAAVAAVAGVMQLMSEMQGQRTADKPMERRCY
ncbi:16S rRNA (uracil(1498)-N(3))-methyltransferase [candidate division WOR-3 bacterium]|nr:16S rRNA (uracil(1498)-N(3))-methyltransferase [candidate division WOR-3 bacterium]